MRYFLFNDTVFEFIKVFLVGVEIFFVAYLIGYSTFLFISVITGSSSLFRKRQQDRLKNTILKDHFIPISIIVPAFNEDVTIVENVRSLLSLNYPLYEIIVVDDGSSDETSAKLIEAFDMLPIRRPIQRKVECQPVEFVYEAATPKVPLTLIRKKNGGKADSLNMGMQISLLYLHRRGFRAAARFAEQDRQAGARKRKRRGSRRRCPSVQQRGDR